MSKYEMLYILNVKLDDATKDAVIAKFENIVTSNGGKVESTDKWGEKKLAYEINDETEGFYVLMTFECETSLVKELTRVAGITEGLIRNMIIKID